MITAKDIVKLLRERHKQPEWITVDELRVSTGYTRGEERIDFWAMDTFPSQAFKRIAYEIKLSKSDFQSEIRKPAKRKPALLLSNQFYFVAPAGIIPVDRIPIDAGLMEVTVSSEGHTYLKVVSKAPWLDTEPASWGFVAALMRRAHSRTIERK
jgi:hypothetical protein